MWAVKLQLIYKLAMESEADEALNYGIYYPKAGIFLDEQRVLASYFFTDNVRTAAHRMRNIDTVAGVF